ncbi:hypothetical protein VM98_34130, partial [Streptomyces rubellomurinus subsp. indigoferus]
APGTVRRGHARVAARNRRIHLVDGQLVVLDPREAVAMVRQQRVLVDICWDGSERTRVDPLSLRCSLCVGGAPVEVASACSSCVGGLHWAGHGVRTGDWDVGLAGGVTRMSTAGVFVEFARQRGLAPG